jgi:predicted nucleotidyltransferase
VQYDGFVLNPESWTNEFLKYDYIGAPWLVANWSVRDFNFPPETLGTLIVGNGGFCLRSKKFLETSAHLSKEGKIPKKNPEDVAMCVWYRDEFEKAGISFAPPELASLFSIEGTEHEYKKQFGFHGFTWTDIGVWINDHQEYPAIVETFNKAKTSRFHSSLILERENKLGKIKEVFEDIALEGHVLGSVARRDSDPYSDLDVWLTFKDEDFAQIMENRKELFDKIGQVVTVVEPPQNAPIGGIFSAVLFKTSRRLLTIDFYLCPESTAFITDESKKIFGDSQMLPTGVLGLNPQKVTVARDYRVDFCVGFLMTSIKKLARKNDRPLEALLREYNYLREKYDIPVKEIINTGHTFKELYKIIENLKEVANDTQKKVIIEIEKFAKLVEENS